MIIQAAHQYLLSIDNKLIEDWDPVELSKALQDLTEDSESRVVLSHSQYEPLSSMTIAYEIIHLNKLLEEIRN